MKTLSLAVLSVLALVGCNYMERKGGAGSQPIEEPVLFKQVMAEVFAPNCISCHRQGGAIADLTTREAMLDKGWIVPGDPAASQIFMSVVAGRMPKGGPTLEPRLVALLEKWILDGAPGEDVPIAPPEEKAGYEKLLADVVGPRCAGCHSGAEPAADLDVTDYSQVMGYVVPGNPGESFLYEAVETQYMPPRKPLSAAQVNEIKQWILDGAKERT